MKKLFFILGLILSFNAMAETKTYQCGDNCTATLDDSGVLRVSGTGEMYDYDMNTRYETPWFNNRGEIKGVVVEEGITSVGAFSLFDCEYIEKIELAKSVNYVQPEAFDEDRYIQNITMYDSTTWFHQDDMNAYNDSPSIKIYCHGDMDKCKENFLERMNSKFKGNPSFYYKGKRIYTIDEANRVAGKVNSVKIRYR